MTDQITPEEHSDIVGGSTAGRRIGCPASYRLEQKVPDEVKSDSIYAREGTALHELMAKLLLDPEVDPLDLLPFAHTQRDRETGEELWTFEVDRDLWDEKGAPALAAFDAFLDKLEEEEGEPAEFLIERRVEFPGIAGAFGTSDIVGKCGSAIFVADWKFGFKPVDVTENPQLMFYGRAALNTCASFLGALKPQRRVVLAIIQPVGAGLSRWDTTVDELDRFRFTLYEAIDEARKAETPRMAKGKWCDFARCKTICPLWLNPGAVFAEKWEALQAAQAQQQLEGARDPETGSIIGRDVIDWGALYGELVGLAEQVEEWAAEVHKQAKAYAEAGGVVAGYKLVERRGGGRKWAQPEKTVEGFLRRAGLKIDDFAPRKLITLPQAEKKLKPLGKDIPAKYVQEPGVTSTALVHEDNAKPAHVPVAAKLRELAERLGS